MLSTGPFPYDDANLLGGGARILYAPMTTAVPTGIEDVIDVLSPYVAKTGWKDFGATKESFTYSRNFDTSGWEIQNVNGTIFDEITDISRSAAVSIAELAPETIQIMEEAPAGGVVHGTPTAGQTKQQRIGFGGFDELSSYRVAFISKRKKKSGVVNEPTLTRGRWVMGVLYSCSISADEVSVEQNKGDLTAFGLTFTAYPAPNADAQPAGEEFGAWYFEDAGTIT